MKPRKFSQGGKFLDTSDSLKTAVRSHAQSYLDKHGIEKKLSNCMKLLLQKQPEDPVEFICCYLRDRPYSLPTKKDPIGLTSTKKTAFASNGSTRKHDAPP